MPGPSQLTITLVAGGSFSVPIPAALQGLDSTTPGSVQTGFSSADIAIRNIFRGGGATDLAGNWYPAVAISKIVAS